MVGVYEEGVRMMHDTAYITSRAYTFVYHICNVHRTRHDHAKKIA